MNEEISLVLSKSFSYSLRFLFCGVHADLTATLQYIVRSLRTISDDSDVVNLLLFINIRWIILHFPSVMVIFDAYVHVLIDLMININSYTLIQQVFSDLRTQYFHVSKLSYEAVLISVIFRNIYSFLCNF